MIFKSNGKLLLSGEYVLLDGAKALALPTQLGQSLEVVNTNTNQIHWQSFDVNGKIWFIAKYDILNLSVLQTSDDEKALLLQKFLITCKKLNTYFLNGAKGFNVNTHLEFDKNWGLGSSSTLLNNLAQWAQINPFELLKKSFIGSGYDVACASQNKPIIYQIKNEKLLFETVQLNENITKYLYFVYLNQKQNSREAIQFYKKKQFDIQQVINDISEITEKMIQSNSLSKFEKLIVQHENILSAILKMPTVKEKFFNDYRQGQIKSLGAWGGDFILATSQNDPSLYFKNKGFNTVLSYEQII